MDSDKKNKIVQILMGIFIIIWVFSMWSTFENRGPDQSETVPLFNLPVAVHMRIFFIIWPLLGSLIAVIVFPRIFAPIYMKSKKLMLPKYENGYIETKKVDFNLKKFFWRGLYCYLLSLGLMIALKEFLNLDLFASENQKITNESLNLPIEYTYNGYFQIIFLFFPIAAGLLSIGWAIEDAGVIHYNLPDTNTDELFEIEPVHLRYNSIIKGYAGLSSIFYFTSVIWYIFVIRTDLIMSGDGWQFFFYPLSIIMFPLMMYPAYKLYLFIGKDFLRKKLPKRKSITKQEYQS